MRLLKTQIRKLCETAFLSILLLFASGCGTVIPPNIESESVTYDPTTPESENGWNSGFIDFVKNERGETTGGLFTKGAIDRYNSLISDYRIQFKEETGREINVNDGVSLYKEQDGRQIYFLNSQRCSDFLRLNRWSKQPSRKKDSVWMQLKDKMLQ